VGSRGPFIKGTLAGAACLACLVFAGDARAQASVTTSCAEIEGGSPALAAVDGEARLTFIRNVMRDQAARAKTWRWAWTGIGLALAAGSYGLIPFENTQTKKYEQVYVGTATLFIPLQLTVLPIRVGDYDAILERAAVDAEVAKSHMMTCLVLDHAEDQLRRAAKDEAALTGPLTHIVDLVLDAGFVTVLWLAFRDVGGTILNGVGSVVVSESQILTTPRGAIRALEQYRRGDISGPVAPPPPRVSWTLAPLGVAPGVSLVARF
jgi:hypothetical protein